ncbi:MAG: cardiolipin synthase B [Gammaproteobacteria bacterium]|nr:cardiolipin synthase B [Gammaproteobacteria bacterium]
MGISEPEASPRSDTGNFISQCLGRSFTDHNSISTLRNGDEIFPALNQAIDSARKSIEFQTFIYWPGQVGKEFAQRLADAADRGVAVRVLLDSFGCASIDRSALKILQRGCQVCWFRPISKVKVWQNLKRSHRKFLVCDGRIGFTGGVGIGDEWLGNGRTSGQWRDDHFQIEGPVVNSLRAAFLENWIEACKPEDDLISELEADSANPAGDEYVIPVPSTASDFWSTAATLIRIAIAAANSSLQICTPYFVTDRKLENSLIDAKERGVDVRIMIPEPANSDSKLAALASVNCIPRLLEHDIPVYAYQPTLIHRKCLLINDEVAIIGSVNFNQRSQRKDDEFCLVIDKGKTVHSLIESFKEDCRYSRELNLSEFRKRHKLLGKFARTIAPLRRHL